MAPKNTPWTNSYPTSQDTPGTEQPTLVDDTAPGALDGDRLLASHANTLKDKLQSVAESLGDVSGLPAGSLKERVSVVERRAPEDLLPASPSAYDEEFEDGTLDVKWSWVGAGQPSGGNEEWHIGTGRLSALLEADGGGDDIGNDAHIIEQTIPSLSGNWRASVKLHLFDYAVNFSRFGLIVRNNADWNNLMLFSVGSASTRFWDKRDSGAWTYDRDATAILDKGIGDYFILGLRHDQSSTLLIPEYSYDGVIWVPTGTSLDYTTLGATPNRIGVNLWTNTGTAIKTLAMVDWFRVETLP